MKIQQFLGDVMQARPGSIKISMKSQVEQYRFRYEELIKTHTVKSTIYRVKPQNRILVHVKVPSKTLKSFYYDVLFELIGNDKTASIEECDIKLFSNSPSFVYGGFGYIFYHMSSDPSDQKFNSGMMIDIFRNKIPVDRVLISGTEKKLGKESVHTEPTTRNPMGIPIPDFSIYCGLFHLIDTYKYDNLRKNRNHVTETQLARTIPDFNHLMAERKRVEHAEKEERRKNREKEEKKLDELHKASLPVQQRGVKRPSTMRSAQSMKRTSSTRSPKSTRRG